MPITPIIAEDLKYSGQTVGSLPLGWRCIYKDEAETIVDSVVFYVVRSKTGRQPPVSGFKCKQIKVGGVIEFRGDNTRQCCGKTNCHPIKIERDLPITPGACCQGIGATIKKPTVNRVAIFPGNTPCS